MGDVGDKVAPDLVDPPELAGAERLGLVGESGSGKSVTSLSIMRLIPSPPAPWAAAPASVELRVSLPSEPLVVAGYRSWGWGGVAFAVGALAGLRTGEVGEAQVLATAASSLPGMRPPDGPRRTSFVVDQPERPVRDIVTPTDWMANLWSHGTYYWDGRMPSLEAVCGAAWKGQLGGASEAVVARLSALADPVRVRWACPPACCPICRCRW